MEAQKAILKAKLIVLKEFTIQRLEEYVSMSREANLPELTSQIAAKATDGQMVMEQKLREEFSKLDQCNTQEELDAWRNVHGI